MKRSSIILLVGLLLSSCVSGSRMVEINDSDREIKGIKLMQKLTGTSAEKAASINGGQHGPISFVYSLEIKEKGQAILSLDIQVRTSIRTDELDSVIFLSLDNEEIRLGASDFKPKKLMPRQFIIPENLWVSIANTEKIQYLLYFGKEEIVVPLNGKQTRKLKEFLVEAMQLRDANLPPIPEGLKKL